MKLRLVRDPAYVPPHDDNGLWDVWHERERRHTFVALTLWVVTDAIEHGRLMTWRFLAKREKQEEENETKAV